MATHSIAGTVAGAPGSYIDLAATLGYTADAQDRDLDAVIGIQSEIDIPSMPGSLMVGPERTAVRVFSIGGWLDGATKAAVLTNLNLLKAIATDGLVWVKVADWSTVEIQCKCIEFKVDPDPARHVSTAQHVTMTFRAVNPYWRDVTPTSPTFGVAHQTIAQGTAPGDYVMLSPVGVLAICVIGVWDYLDAALSSTTLEALTAGQQYRITNQPPVLTIEKFVGGVWTFADSAKTAGVFPKLLPSNGVAYQTAAWPRVSASVGTWTLSNFRKRWR